jgi:hypothetical protein
MSMNLTMPGQLVKTEPGQPFKSQEFIFPHVPSLRELLPQFRGLPGFEYLQCCVQNLRRAQDEGWTEVERTVIYTIEGEKGRVDLKLLARGKRIPGQPHDSGARLCICDKTVEEVTGVYINPHLHETQEDPGPEEEPEVFTGGQSNAA